MKKIILFFLLLGFCLSGYSQSLKLYLELPDSTTLFGRTYPKYTVVYDRTIKRWYVLDVAVTAGQKLSNVAHTSVSAASLWSDTGTKIYLLPTLTSAAINVGDTFRFGNGTTGGTLNAWGATITNKLDLSVDTVQGLKATKVETLDSFFISRWTAQTATSRDIVWSVQPASDGLGVIVSENSQRAQTTFGVRNRFIGMNAGNTALSGTDNYGVGFNTLNALTSGIGNIAFGTRSMQILNTGIKNLALGDSSLILATTCKNNYAFGHGALATTTTMSNQINIGTAKSFQYYSYKNLITVGTTNPATTFGGAYTLAGTTTGRGYAAITGLTDGTSVAWAEYRWDVTGVTIIAGSKASASNMWAARDMTTNDSLMIFYRAGVGLVITTGTPYASTKYLTDSKQY